MPHFQLKDRRWQGKRNIATRGQRLSSWIARTLLAGSGAVLLVAALWWGATDIRIVSLFRDTFGLSGLTAAEVGLLSAVVKGPDNDTVNQGTRLNDRGRTSEEFGALNRMTKYGNPTFRQADGGVLLSNDRDAPAGIYFRFRVDATTRYRLTIAGATTGGAPVLRTRHDDSKPSYSAAVDGVDSLIFGGPESYEVLIYGDGPFEYRLETLRLRRCTQCKLDADLVQLIRDEIPGLDQIVAAGPLQGARRLSDWVANVGDFALSARAEAHDRVVRGSAAGIFYQIFLPDRGGVYCGGYSIFLDKVLQLFGYASFTVNYGDLRDGLTHVNVVVPVRRLVIGAAAPEFDFYFFDPTFNGIYVDTQTGVQLPIREMLKRIVDGQQDSIRIEEMPLDRREYLAMLDEDGRCPTLIERTNHFLVCAYPGFGIDTYLEGLRDALVGNGYPARTNGLPGLAHRAYLRRRK